MSDCARPARVTVRLTVDELNRWTEATMVESVQMGDFIREAVEAYIKATAAVPLPSMAFPLTRSQAAYVEAIAARSLA